MALAQDIRSLVDYALACSLVAPADRVWAYNSILEAVGATGPEPGEDWVLEPAAEPALLGAESQAPADAPAADPAFDLESTLASLAEAAVQNGVAEDTASGRDRAAMRVMGVLTPRPAEVQARFDGLVRAGDARAATDYFYKLCCDAGYVRRAAIARNIGWATPTRWGDLEITINLSKPEKDPRDIAAAGKAKNTGEKYPACQLCIENEGYPGRSAASGTGDHPARQNLRIIPLSLNGDRYGLQYSPYAYFNEHAIVMSAHHRPMHIDRACLSCLLDFVDLLPQYFIGSNADLPIVGGSILSHDHFQGGDHEFPMMKAATAQTFSIPGHDGVTGEVLQWPMSVLRLSSASRASLLEAAVHVIDSWRAYTDASAGVVAHDADGTPHNTVTPVVRKRGDVYTAYLALRCNVTDAANPLGVFHPHAQWHHIKKENIGLIEVMGLAILPPRLVGELAAVRQHLLEGELDTLGTDPLTASHASWALEVAAAHPELNEGNAEQVIRDEVGAVFGHVLEDAGVFKWDEAGRAAQQRFLDQL